MFVNICSKCKTKFAVVGTLCNICAEEENINFCSRCGEILEKQIKKCTICNNK